MTICDWATKYEEERIYHNEEWGRFTTKSNDLYFEFLILEGAQAGLSWRTILNKREAIVRCFIISILNVAQN